MAPGQGVHPPADVALRDDLRGQEDVRPAWTVERGDERGRDIPDVDERGTRLGEDAASEEPDEELAARPGPCVIRSDREAGMDGDPIETLALEPSPDLLSQDLAPEVRVPPGGVSRGRERGGFDEVVGVERVCK